MVGGEVTPDQFTVDKPTMRIRDRQVRQKGVRAIPAQDGGTRMDEVPADMAGRPSLTDDEVLKLATIGRRLERQHGGHVDIERGVD